MKYDIEFEHEGEIKMETYLEMKDVGMAFAWCLHEHPGARLIRGRAFGMHNDVTGAYEKGWTDYTPPPVQREPVKEPRPARALNKKEKGCEFQFYDKVKSVSQS